MPEITRFGPGKAPNNTGGDGVTWFDIDIADDADRQWLMAWQEISEQTRTALLEPVPLRQTPRPRLVPDRVDTRKKDAVVHLTDVYAGGGLAGLSGRTTIFTASSG